MIGNITGLVGVIAVYIALGEIVIHLSSRLETLSYEHPALVLIWPLLVVLTVVNDFYHLFKEATA